MAAERVVRRPVVTARCAAIAYVLASLVAGPLSTLVRALAGHGFGSEADSSHFGKSVEIHQLKRFMPQGCGMIASMAA